MIEKLIGEAKELANKLTDPKEKAECWAVIASVTHDDEDIERAEQIASEVYNDEEKARILVACCAVLAESKKKRSFNHARELAQKIADLSSYWASEAYIIIYRYSEDRADLVLATSIAESIRVSDLQAQVISDIRAIGQRGTSNPKEKECAFQEMVAALWEITDPEHLSHMASQITSVGARFKLTIAIARVLGQEMG